MHFPFQNFTFGRGKDCSKTISRAQRLFFFDLGLGKAVGKIDPTVGLAQPRETALEFKQVVYTVL